MSNAQKLPPLEAGLITAMRALDNQVARQMQRSPDALAVHGVQKWEPYQQRVEQLSSFLLDALANRHVQLDSLLIMAQALSKTLSLFAQDLQEEGLGKVRSLYCRAALEHLREDATRALAALRDESPDDGLM